MTTKIIVCLIALSVGLIQIFNGAYTEATLAIAVGIMFLISILHNFGEDEEMRFGDSHKREDDDDDDEY